MILLKLCLGMLGLLLPGYAFARLIRLEHAWAAAFPLSALFLVETVIVFSITGISIRFGTLAGVLLAAVLVCHGCGYLRRQPDPQSPPDDEDAGLPRYIKTTILLLAMATLTIVAWRTALFPLMGFDTFFRWEGLARAMLHHQSLAFYPPVSAADFAIYSYPDGIPPLVATVYWWLYACQGEVLPRATSISVVLQLGTAMGLVFFATSYAFGRRAAWFALLATTATPLLISGFAIGQETGFTALAVAGQLCFTYAAVRNPRLSTVIVSALFAALGAMARDYGPALSLAGLAVLAWHPPTRRYLPAFILTATLLTAPWYLRNWALTGNPFFSHRIPVGFTVNPVHAAIMDYYKELFSFGQFSLNRWLAVFKHLAAGGLLVLCSGLPWLFIRWRDSAPLLVTTLVIVLLWIYSVGQTAGGVIFSTRVLTPALLVLSIATGVALSHIFRAAFVQRSTVRVVSAGMLFLLAGYTMVSAAVYPKSSKLLFTVPTATPVGSLQEAMIDRLDKTDLPATGVLTDQPFFAALMQSRSRFRPVVYWSPEVDFIFDRSLQVGEIRRRLLEKNIHLVLVDQQSSNNKFLATTEFFRDRSTWNVLFTIPDEAGFFYFSGKPVGRFAPNL